MTEDQKQRRLVAIHSMTIALVGLVEDMMGETPTGGCAHPPEQRENTSTMSAKSWKCRLCGYELTQ